MKQPKAASGNHKAQAHPIKEEDQHGRAMKKQQKKASKQKRREERAATGGNTTMDNGDDAGMEQVAMEDQDRPYNFALDFV